MGNQKDTINRRSFLRASALAGGGLMISFGWMVSCKPNKRDEVVMPDQWFELNGYIKIGENGLVTIMSPNPEGGQNVKTSMPMIVAEELDIDWARVIVEQAPLNTEDFRRQFIGGSQAIRQGWQILRTAGATGRRMLMEAAGNAWNVPVNEITTRAGTLFHEGSGQEAGYGEMAAAAATLSVPEKVPLKDVKDFRIIGTSQKNVEGKNIVTGKPLFGYDIQRGGMHIAMIVHPPAFGMKFSSMDDARVRQMPGIRDVFLIKVLEDDFERQHFDTCTFLEVVAIVGDSTWQVMNAKKSLNVQWEPFKTHSEQRTYYGQSRQTVTIPAGLESTEDHRAAMDEEAGKSASVVRKDGDPEASFQNAAKIIERTYNAPHLAHNCMEPMNFFADVRDGYANLEGPLQKPELTELALSARLGIPVENIDIKMTRLGGGFGRRSYAHWLIESALISQKMKAPVKLLYTREDDMTGGIYRPPYQASYRAALDSDNNLVAVHINAGGIPESPLYANRFPAGTLDNYLAESWTINTNITIGSYRAPRSNFIGGVEQAFLDEVAEAAGEDPIEFRLKLLERAKNDPVGENNDYDPARYAGVLELVREKSNWGQSREGVYRGVSAYFCHNTYVANVLDLVMENGRPKVDRVTCAVDCGIVINPDAATNMAEGAIVDGIGAAMYGELTFSNGVPTKNNFNNYRMLRMSEAPNVIDVHFVQNNIDPTGMGEPTYPPVIGALANALYKATGKRYYSQPFMGEGFSLG